MDIQKKFNQTSFLLLFTITILSILHMQVQLNEGFSMCIQSIACVYVGATRSLQAYQLSAKTNTQEQALQNENSVMSLKTAMSIPIIATLSLLGVYFLIVQQWTMINSLILTYFAFLGTLTLKGYLYAYFKNTSFAQYDYAVSWLPLRTRFFSINLTFLELICLGMSSYIAFIYVKTNFWVANNIFAICFAVYAIETWLVGNFKHIFLIFGGLILYDLIFVFGSDVMMTVAQGLDLPIKILVPREVSMKSFSMIGLGDIVIPGLLSSMCLRCDLINCFRESRSKALKDGQKDPNRVQQLILEDFSSFYFYCSLVGYVFGFILTIAAMSILKTPQPALLYILPAMLLCYLLGAFGRKELVKMAGYDEDSELSK